MGKIAFVFAGQGAQYAGMGKELADKYEVSKKIFDEADKELGFSISKMCFEGPQEELDKTENTQPAILTTSIAILEILKTHNIIPDVVAGLSLGEYSALVCSGAISFKDAVKLVKKRGKFMQEAVEPGVGKMAAILGLDPQKVKTISADCSNFGVVEASNFNCPGQIVIGGEKLGVEAVCTKVKEAGGKAIPLQVSAPFHTSMMESASQKLKIELKNINFSGMSIPVVENSTADYIKNKDQIEALLVAQVKSPVLWENTIKRMADDGVDTFIEIGPKKVLSGFNKKINPGFKILNVEDLNSLEKTLSALEEK